MRPPDVCTLPAAERPLRLAEFDDLFATALRGVEPVDPTHARLRLTGPVGLADTVRDLTERETRCCSFFTFTLRPDPPGTAGGDPETLVLEIQVPHQYTAVLASLVDRADLAGRR
jgi:hypothetical protein